MPLKGGENREGYDIYKNSVLRSSVVDSLAFKCVKSYSSALRLNSYIIIILLFSVLLCVTRVFAAISIGILCYMGSLWLLRLKPLH